MSFTAESLQGEVETGQELAFLFRSLDETKGVEELLDTFFFELEPWIQASGMQFRNEHRDINYAVGLDGPYRCAYRLFAYHNFLGELSFTRTSVFEQDELELLDNIIALLTDPLSLKLGNS